MADRLEKNEVCRTLSHAGLSSKRMRYAAFTNPTVLPSCDQCLREMLQSLMSYDDDLGNQTRPCSTCCNWEYSDRPAWIKAAPRPANYPETITNESKALIEVPENRDIGHAVKHIKPQEQSFTWMKQGVDLTVAEISNGNWTATNGHCYLQSLAVSNIIAKVMVAEGTLRNKKRKAKELYNEQDVIPAIWLMGYDLKDFIECPMHCELYLQ